MMMNKRPTGSNPVYFAGAALAALIGGGLWFKLSQPPHGEPISPTSPSAFASPAPSSSATPPTQAASPAPTPRTETTIYTVVNDADGSHLEPKTVSAKGGAAKVADPVGALNAMSALPNSPLPKGTVALEAFVDKTGLGHVGFNEAFKTNFSGGDRGEALVLNAVTQTMGQFGAKQVQITVGGKKIDSLGGMQSLDEPLPVAPPGKTPLTQAPPTNP